MIRKGTWRQAYTVIPNAIFESNLSAESIGVLCYLISKPEHWKVSAMALGRHFGVGKSKVTRILGELQAAGYASKKLGGDGRGGG